MRTDAGPSEWRRWVLSGGPYTVARMSAGPRGVAAAVPEAGLCPTRTCFGPKVCPFGQRAGGRVIHFPAVVCTNSPASGTPQCYSRCLPGG